MKLRTGILIAGAETPVGDGINCPVRAAIKVDGEMYSAIIKRIDPQMVFVECFCAMVLRAWTLPVPEPVLILEDGGGILFASIDAGYPSLKQRIGWTPGLPDAHRRVIEEIGIRLVCGLPDAARILAADEAIANADRNLGNILWDGASHAYIDHERAMDLVPFPHNLMAEMAKRSNRADEIEKGAVAAALSLSTDPIRILEWPEQLDISQMLDFIDQRIPALAMKILARFPKPTDLFSSLPNAP